LRGENPANLRAALGRRIIGIVGDRPFQTQLVELMKDFSGVLAAGATVINSDNGNQITIPRADDTSNTGQIVAEATTDNTAADPTRSIISPSSAFKFDSKWIKVSTELVQDSAFDPHYVSSMRRACASVGRSIPIRPPAAARGQPKGFVRPAQSERRRRRSMPITYNELIDLSIPSIRRIATAARVSGSFTTRRSPRSASYRTATAATSLPPGEAGQPGSILGYNTSSTTRWRNSRAAFRARSRRSATSRIISSATFPILEVVVARELFAGDGLIGYRVFSRHDGKLDRYNGGQDSAPCRVVRHVSRGPRSSSETAASAFTTFAIEAEYERRIRRNVSRLDRVARSGRAGIGSMKLKRFRFLVLFSAALIIGLVIGGCAAIIRGVLYGIEKTRPEYRGEVVFFEDGSVLKIAASGAVIGSTGGRDSLAGQEAERRMRLAAFADQIEHKEDSSANPQERRGN
jgi:hypothetical protein